MELGDELRSMLLAQAAYRADQEKLEKSLTPAEKSIRARFERALFGKDGPLELCALTVTHPTTLLAMAEAYRREGRYKVHALGPKAKADAMRAAEEPYKIMMFMLIMVWLASRGHAEAQEILAQRRRMPPPPPLPRDWWQYKPMIFAAMGDVLPPEPPKVTVLPTPLTQGLRAI